MPPASAMRRAILRAGDSMSGLPHSSPHSARSRQDRPVQPGIGNDLGNISTLRQPASLESYPGKPEEEVCVRIIKTSAVLLGRKSFGIMSFTNNAGRARCSVRAVFGWKPIQRRARSNASHPKIRRRSKILLTSAATDEGKNPPDSRRSGLDCPQNLGERSDAALRDGQRPGR